MAPRSIFCFFLDHEVHKLFGIERQYGKERVFNELMMATKLAFLLCEESILVPASNYFESDFSFRLLNSLCAGFMQNLGVVKLVSSSNSLEELLKKKSAEHEEMISREGYHYGEFINQQQDIFLPGILIRRERSASSDIRQAWYRNIDALGRGINDLFPNTYTAKELESTLAQIPSLLERRAFISKYLLPFFKTSINNEISFDNYLNRFITREYIRSFLDEYDAVCLCNIPVLESADHILPPPPKYKHLSYKKYLNLLVQSNYQGENAYRFVQRSSLDDLYFFKVSNSWKDLYERSVSSETKPRKFYFLTQSKENDNTSEEIIMPTTHNLPKMLLVVATPLELEVLIKKLNAVGEVKKTVSSVSYFSATIGKTQTYVVKSQMGQGGSGGAILTIEEAIRVLNPNYVIMGGIAWGGYKEKQSIGDLLISNQVWDYDIERKNPDGTTTYRGPISPSSPHLVQMFEVACATTLSYKTRYGLIASGSNLYDNKNLVDELKAVHSELIGGDMESAGMASVCTRKKVDWIMAKGICDWGYDKNEHKDEYQELAANNSMDAIVSLLLQFSPQ